MNIKEAAQIVDNPPPINWEWLAGFFQAEGSLSINDRNHPYIIISQKDVPILELINQFIERELDYKAKMHHLPSGINDLRIFKSHTVAQFLLHTLPYLHEPKRYLDSVPRSPFGWDFLTGFWEGDGSVGKHSSGGLIYSIAQKSPEILEAIRAFLDKGSIRQATNRYAFNPDNKIHLLQIYDEPKMLPLTLTMLQHVRASFRRLQIVTTVLECNHET